MSNKPVLTGISLTEYEREVVIRESGKRGLNNFSAMLRVIIREWEESQSKNDKVNSEQQKNN